jgi:hypothetical protein
MDSEILELKHYIRIIRESKCLGPDSLFPSEFRQDALHAIQTSYKEGEQLVLEAWRSMLDKIGFLNWWIACTPSSHELLDTEELGLYAKGGYESYAK